VWLNRRVCCKRRTRASSTTRSRPEFAAVLEKLAGGQHVEAEINSRQIKVIGTTTIGASFDVDGNLVTSDANFIRLFPERAPAAINLGVVRLRPGSDPAPSQRRVAEDLWFRLAGPHHRRIQGARQGLLSSHVGLWISSSQWGTVVGFFVGFAIVYQVLFSDVNNHLPQYATLKAIGYTDGYLRRVVLEEAVILSLLGYFPQGNCMRLP